MKKIKEAITALTAGDFPGAIHINRKEHSPMSDERFSLIVKSVTNIAASIAAAVTAMNVDGWKLLTLVGAGVVFVLIYFGTRD